MICTSISHYRIVEEIGCLANRLTKPTAELEGLLAPKSEQR